MTSLCSHSLLLARPPVTGPGNWIYYIQSWLGIKHQPEYAALEMINHRSNAMVRGEAECKWVSLRKLKYVCQLWLLIGFVTCNSLDNEIKMGNPIRLMMSLINCISSFIFQLHETQICAEHPWVIASDITAVQNITRATRNTPRQISLCKNEFSL